VQTESPFSSKRAVKVANNKSGERLNNTCRGRGKSHTNVCDVCSLAASLYIYARANFPSTPPRRLKHKCTLARTDTAAFWNISINNLFVRRRALVCGWFGWAGGRVVDRQTGIPACALTLSKRNLSHSAAHLFGDPLLIREPPCLSTASAVRLRWRSHKLRG
jgi:hypothetical protein